MTSIEKAILGALGGLSAVLVKFLGQDYENVVSHAANLTAEQLLSYKIGYGLLTPILMFLGAFIGWLSDEQKRMKIVALAIAAPAMVTTWSAGEGDTSPAPPHQAALISSAFAQSPEGAKEKLPPAHPDTLQEKSVWERIEQGVGVFFGRDKQPRRYWVVVGSFTDKRAAVDFSDAVNEEAPALNAWVGGRLPGNAYYPVIVGGHLSLSLSEARELKQKALATNTVKEAYLATGVSR
jgi:hypothetical protein